MVDADGQDDVRVDAVGSSKVVPRLLLTLRVVDDGKDGRTCIELIITSDVVVADGVESGVGGASVMSMGLAVVVDVVLSVLPQ